MCAAVTLCGVSLTRDDIVRAIAGFPTASENNDPRLGDRDLVDGAAHLVAGGEVFDRLAGLGERSRDAVRRVDPEDPYRLRAPIAKRVLAALGDVRRVVLIERRDDPVDLDLGDSLEDGHLLVAVVDMHRRTGAFRVDADPAREARVLDRAAGDERQRHDAAASIERLHLVDLDDHRVPPQPLYGSGPSRKNVEPST